MTDFPNPKYVSPIEQIDDLIIELDDIQAAILIGDAPTEKLQSLILAVMEKLAAYRPEPENESDLLEALRRAEERLAAVDGVRSLFTLGIIRAAIAKATNKQGAAK
jgi:hypothetical protein